MLRGWYNDLESRVGVRSLVYGTVEEFGMGIKIGGDMPAECVDGNSSYTARLVCGANNLLRDRFPQAPLRNAANGSAFVHGSWTSVIVDFADPDYAEFMMNNTDRVVKEFSGSGAAGLCLDRGDYIGLLNSAADDGVTMWTSAPAPDASGVQVTHVARPLIHSWRQLIPRIAERLHAATPEPMALFVNPDCSHRLDMYEGVDGRTCQLFALPLAARPEATPA